MATRLWAAHIRVFAIGLAPAQGRFGKTFAEGSWAQAVGPVKLALLTGVNEYAAPDIFRLRGPLNDVLNMRQVLQDFYAFEPGKILTLTNGAAKRGVISSSCRNVNPPLPAC